MLRVLLADDQSWLRSAMRLLLEQDPEIEIIGEAVEVRSLLAKVFTAQPDLVLLDWELPGLTSADVGLRVLRTLHKVAPHVRIIALSGLPNAGGNALAAGAEFFVSKADPPEALLAALQAVKSAIQKTRPA
jgi:DNA-binding NarL/FixJ family response regulator